MSIPRMMKLETHPDGPHPHAVAIDHGVGVHKCVARATPVSCIALVGPHRCALSKTEQLNPGWIPWVLPVVPWKQSPPRTLSFSSIDTLIVP